MNMRRSRKMSLYSAAKAPLNRRARGRIRTLETLEGRAMLSAVSVSPWQNQANHLDVNADGRVTPLDALSIINSLNNGGARALTSTQAATSIPGSTQTATSTVAKPLYYDVSGDGVLSAVDALFVINALNETPPSMRIRLQAADLSGNPISFVDPGADFQLQAFVQDLRTENADGVFSAYVDVTYDENLATVNPPLNHSATYPNAPKGDIDTPGLIDEAGGIDGLTALGSQERLLWNVVFTAGTSGTIVFTPDPADEPDSEVLLFGEFDVVPQNHVELVGTSLAIGAPLPSLSINDVSVAEGNAGTTNATFTVTLSASSTSAVTVVYSTADVSATAPSDYAAQSNQTLTFAPGQTTRTITVQVNGDTLSESNETFNVNLTGPSGATISDGQGVGTILDDDGAPSLSINDISVTEGNAGTTNAVFTVTLSAVSGQTVTVEFATGDGTASAPADYTAQTGTVTFAPGETTKTVSVSVNGDLLDEADETFSVTLSNPTSGVSLLKPLGTGTITDDDPLPSISIGDVSLIEGNAGTSNATFTVTLSAPSGRTVTVLFATANGTATQPADYQLTTGTLTFAPGATSATINVPVVGETLVEQDESFFVNLSGPTNATISDGAATGTILDDDGLPFITIDDASVNEGDTGSVNATFTVSLSRTSTQVVRVGFATANNTATAGTDFTAVSGELTFNPGETTKTITVPVLGDTVREGNETFFVNLSSPIGGTISDAQGIGTILDDDLEELTVSDVRIVEGPSVVAVFTVALSAASVDQVTVEFATSNGSATAGNDYEAISGTITFAPGETRKTITVPILDDNLTESTEDFFVTLTNAVNAVLDQDQGTGMIFDDETPVTPRARIRLAATDTAGSVLTSVNPGDSFVLRAFVQDLRPVANSDPRGVAAAYLDVLYDSSLVTVDGPFTFGPTYQNATSGNIAAPDLIDEAGAFDGLDPLGTTERLLWSVPVTALSSGNAIFTADPADEQDHEVLLFGESAALDPPEVEYVSTTLTIGANAFSINDVTVTEGNAGTLNAVFTVTRFLPNGQTATVAFATQNGTATAGQDYIAQNGVLTFGGSETTKTITVPIIGDLLDEIDETFSVVLSNAVNAGLSRSTGVGTILDNDAEPALSVSDAAGSEGGLITFNVTLSAASGKLVTVAFATANGTTPDPATADVDYESLSGTLTFQPGETQKTVSVQALEDDLQEPDETFRLVLSNPTNATIADGEGIGTIQTVVPAQVTGFVYADINNNGIKDPGEIGIQNVIVSLVDSSGAVVQTTLTAANGAYTLTNIEPGSYSIVETHPGFYFDGRDTAGTPAPTGVVANDRFNAVLLGPAVVATGFNFGERGLRPEFMTGRRAFLASSVNTDGNTATSLPSNTVGTLSNIDLRQGTLWIAFDAGWTGTRTFSASFLSSLGSVTLTLYDNNVMQLATSTAGVLQWTGVAGRTYFLKLTGTNPDVDLVVFDGSTILSSSGPTSTTTTTTLTRPLATASSPSTTSAAVADPEDTSMALALASVESSEESASLVDEALASDGSWLDEPMNF